MKKRNGFTLIELLAVIIVLAIIALIAMPIIFNVIENAKIKAMENSTYGVIDAVRLEYMENLLGSNEACADGETTNCGGKITLSGDVDALTVSGEHPNGGTWEIVNAADVTTGRGIKVTNVTFASMAGYKCNNDLATGKVTCAK
ncbi:MAG: prepilin-type N-terminal cleavage/methylation domain-containing protein [Bacilli bacterium]|nr:prepilin-type N-terminal cleavage/methylation domain-containing protein [Bacilli bacterium]